MKEFPENKDWFSEVCDMWPGCVLSIAVKNEICRHRSAYQDIRLYETESCGRMLVLDGMIQFTEADEFAYQEMLAHVPMFSHPNPRRVLVIGGGDGGILRELAKHETVEKIELCEIDGDVVRICREHVPSMAVGFDDPRVEVHIADGNEFIKTRQACYDVIIVDSSDPIGPGEALFQEPFYRAMKSALAPGGVIGTQGESFFMHQDVFMNLGRIIHRLFKHWSYSYMLVPTYPVGNLGVCYASDSLELGSPIRKPTAEMREKLRYYTPELHAASAVLPAFGMRMLDKIRNGG
jgi:spermidine synthase